MFVCVYVRIHVYVYIYIWSLFTSTSRMLLQKHKQGYDLTIETHDHVVHDHVHANVHKRHSIVMADKKRLRLWWRKQKVR